VIELKDLREWANVKTGTEHDLLLVALEARVVQFAQKTTGRFFGATESVTEIRSGADRPILYLNDEPTSGEVESVEIRTGLGGTWTELEETDYEVDGRRLVRLSEAGWPKGTLNLRIVYDRGYEAGSEPGDIRQLVLGIATAMYKGGRTDPADLPENFLNQVAGAKETIERWRELSV
jgi:ABC-type cobalt transport system substrate-binding protein